MARLRAERWGSARVRYTEQDGEAGADEGGPALDDGRYTEQDGEAGADGGGHAGRYAEEDGEAGADEGGPGPAGARWRGLGPKGQPSASGRGASMKGSRRSEMASPWATTRALRRSAGKMASPRGEKGGLARGGRPTIFGGDLP